MRASAVLRSPKIWVFTLFGAVLALVLTFGYLGGVLDTDSPGQRVPIAWVDSGSGVGEQVFTGPARDAARWVKTDTEATARDLLARDEVYAAIVIPADFTARIAAAPVPVVILSNPLAGPAANGTAQGVAHAVLAELSRQLPGDPLKIVVTPVAAVPAHTAGGMAAFYFTLVLILTGFLLAQLLHSGVDGALGFAPREFLHRRSTQPPLPIDRVHTLLVKVGLMAGCSVIAATVVEVVAVLVLGMPVEHPIGLWAFSVLAVATAGVFPLVLLAVIGAPGALLATVVLVVFGVPSSGGAYPPELQPVVFRWLGEVLPMRHITDATRDLIFPTAGTRLPAALIAVAAWLVVSLAIGLGLTAFYDRTGRARISVHERALQTV